MSVLDNNWRIYKDPTYSRADNLPLMFKPRLPPSAVERLAALEDPVIAERIKKWDEARALGDKFELRSIDFVADEACPRAYPMPRPPSLA